MSATSAATSTVAATHSQTSNKNASKCLAKWNSYACDWCRSLSNVQNAKNLLFSSNRRIYFCFNIEKIDINLMKSAVSFSCCSVVGIRECVISIFFNKTWNWRWVFILWILESHPSNANVGPDHKLNSKRNAIRKRYRKSNETFKRKIFSKYRSQIYKKRREKRRATENFHNFTCRSVSLEICSKI